MAKLTILGNDKPIIGKEETYSIASINDWLHLNNNNPFKPPMKPPVTKWGIMVQNKAGWQRTVRNNEEKQIVSYKFTQKSLTHKAVKIVVQQGADKGELIVQPQRAKEPKISKVELLDANYKPIPKGKKLSYKDTIIARAHCVEMFKMNVSFTLWEDDAAGPGHDPVVNAFNKINPIPIVKPVNEKGIAEAIFRLPAYTMAVQIANARIAAGDKSEGATHEYYVTADILNTKIQKVSPNVNVINPTYNPEPPKRERQRELPKKVEAPKQKQTTPPAEKPKPKPDSAKYPITSNGKSNSDPERKIISAEFVDGNGNRLHSSKVGQTVTIKIVARDMKNKKVKVKIWEEDAFAWSHDEIYSGDFLLAWDNNYINNVQLTRKMFDKANDGGGDGKRQDYFIEVIHNETSVKSSAMEVTLDAEPTKMQEGNSIAEIKKQKTEKKDEKTCVCKEYDLVWGNKFTCDERKKVLQICANLWGESKKKEMANHLMNCMALETGEKFKPDTGYLTGGATGLVQWTGTAINAMNRENKYNKGKTLTKALLASMTIIDQLDYVELYFRMWIDSGKNIKDALDLYMCIWCPAAVGKDDSFVCYSEKDSPLNYTANQSIDGEYYREKYTNSKGKVVYNTVGKGNGDKKITKGELRPRLKVKEVSGLNNKTSDFTCNTDSTNSLNAKDIITFHIYANGSIEKHIPKKIEEKNRNKYKYTYHDKENIEHDICILDKITAQNWIVGSKDNKGKGWEKRIAGGKTRYYQKGNGEVELVKLKLPINYNKNGINIKIGDNTTREYINPLAVASMIGAVAECGYNDFNFNGSTSQDGTGAPSVTHVNGVAFDFRYLRKDKTGNNLYIDEHPEALDIIRQEKFIDALGTFGYSKFYSYDIIVNKKNFILKNSTHLVDHNHHLHIRREGYSPKFKEIKA